MDLLRRDILLYALTPRVAHIARLMEGPLVLVDALTEGVDYRAAIREFATFGDAFANKMERAVRAGAMSMEADGSCSEEELNLTLVIRHDPAAIRKWLGRHPTGSYPRPSTGVNRYYNLLNAPLFNAVAGTLRITRKKARDLVAAAWNPHTSYSVIAHRYVNWRLWRGQI